jgi:hypothetical protein
VTSQMTQNVTGRGSLHGQRQIQNETNRSISPKSVDKERDTSSLPSNSAGDDDRTRSYDNSKQKVSQAPMSLLELVNSNIGDSNQLGSGLGLDDSNIDNYSSNIEGQTEDQKVEDFYVDIGKG